MQLTYIKHFNALLQNMQLTKQYHTSFNKLRIIKKEVVKLVPFLWELKINKTKE